MRGENWMGWAWAFRAARWWNLAPDMLGEIVEMQLMRVMALRWYPLHFVVRNGNNHILPTKTLPKAWPRYATKYSNMRQNQIPHQSTWLSFWHDVLGFDTNALLRKKTRASILVPLDSKYRHIYHLSKPRTPSPQHKILHVPIKINPNPRRVIPKQGPFALQP